MNIVSRTDLTRDGNDCKIYESVTLIEEFDMYTVITAKKVIGWSNHKTIYCRSNPTCNLEKAIYNYREYGGVINDNELKNIKGV